MRSSPQRQEIQESQDSGKQCASWMQGEIIWELTSVNAQINNSWTPCTTQQGAGKWRLIQARNEGCMSQLTGTK